MIDRALILADPEISVLLKTKFVTVALDVVHHQHQRDAEGDFYRGIAAGNGQGLYTCQADGKRLGYTNNRMPDRTKDLLKKALEEFRPTEAFAAKGSGSDRWWVRRPPEGGLIVDVTCKVQGGYEKQENPGKPEQLWKQAAQSSLGRDHLWIRKDEHEALAKGELPMSLGRRIVRFHLVDNTRGSPSVWQGGEVRKIELALKEGRIQGAVHLETESGDRGYTAAVLGFVETKEGRVTRLDLLVRGEFWGAVQYSGGAPKGKYPFTVAFTLAAGKDEADKVPPDANKRDPDEYLR